MTQQISPSDRFFEAFSLLPHWFQRSVRRPSKNACWLWTGLLTKEGHGKGARNRPAHRWAYELHHGPLPKGHHVAWTCRSAPLCMNPRHLFAEARR